LDFGHVFEVVLAMVRRIRERVSDRGADMEQPPEGVICHYLAPSAPIWIPYSAPFPLPLTHEQHHL
jgi:hypothetical protein